MRGPALALLSVAVVVAGCGALSAEEKRAKRADYAHSADTACAVLLGDLNSSRKPFGYLSLKSYLVRSDRSAGEAAKRLHDLRGKLGDAKSAQIEAFDRDIDPARTATTALHAAANPVVLHASAKQAQAISVASKHARRAYDRLYRAARAAKLRSCGRGGNRLADNALFTSYNDRMTAVLTTGYRADRKVVFRGNRDRDRNALVRNLRIAIASLRRVKRLDPPADLRRVHRRYVRAAATVLRLERRQNTLLASPLPDYRRIVALIDPVNAAIRRANARARRVFAALDGRYRRYSYSR